MSKKKKRKRKSEPHELENEDSFKGLSKKKTITLENGQKISPYEWKRRFDTQWYFGNRYGTQELPEVDEHKKENERMNNNRKRDILIKQDYALNEENDYDGELVEYEENHARFMETASDEWDWQNAFKQGDAELATKVIYEQAERDLNNSKIDVRITLTRFLTKMLDLHKLIRRERRK